MATVDGDEQGVLTDFIEPIETKTVSHTVSVVCQLKTSERKNERLSAAIKSWQAIADRMSELMPSYRDHQWEAYLPEHREAVRREFPTSGHGIEGLTSKTAYQAAYKVAEAFKSWKGNGKPSDENPRGRFGEGRYARFAGPNVSISKNDGNYGLKVGLEPYNPEWFGINAGDYQRGYLDRIIDGDDPLSSGTAEIHLSDDGTARVHLTVTEDIEVYKVGEVPRWCGVDLGENTIYALAVIEEDEDADENEPAVKDVEMHSGREFRHHRKRLTRKRDERSAAGDLAGVRECRGQRERYTDHVTHVATREIVDIARQHAPCGIAIENLTGYRTSAADPIHDWPTAQLREKLLYKAQEVGLPVREINPADTSVTCRKCGQKNIDARDGDRFACRRCGYEVHADVNAAINIGCKSLQR